MTKASKKVAKVKKAVNTKIPMKLKEYVKRAIAVNVENKTNRFYSGPLSVYDSGNASWGAEDIFPLTPYTAYMTIAQGSGQGDRTGNKIKVKKATLRFQANPTYYHATTNPAPKPLNMDIYIFKVRPQYDALTTVRATALTSFYQAGDSFAGVSSNLSDYLFEVNKDIFLVKRHITNKLGYAIAGQNGANNDAQHFSNNEYHYNALWTIDITKHYPSFIEYNDTATVPASTGLYMMVIAANADQTDYASTVVPANFAYSITLEYEDA